MPKKEIDTVKDTYKISWLYFPFLFCRKYVDNYDSDLPGFKNCISNGLLNILLIIFTSILTLVILSVSFFMLVGTGYLTNIITKHRCRIFKISCETLSDYLLFYVAEGSLGFLQL